MTQAPSCLNLSPLSPCGARPEIREKEVELEGVRMGGGMDSKPFKTFSIAFL